VKKVLIITYYWPPSGGAGVQRWLKFAKYLPKHGWMPVVYTPSNPEYPVEDESLLQDIIKENIVVVKKSIWEPYSFYKIFSGRKKTEKVQAGFLYESSSNRRREKCFRWLRGNLFIPDARKFWIKPSIRFLAKLIKSNSIDLIVSTGPPHSMHLIALGLKKQFDIPWLADFRDPWTQIDFYQHLMLTSIADKMHKRLEKEVVERADRVVTVSRNCANGIKEIADKEVHVITNGYDPDDFKNCSPFNYDSFSITHLGSMNTDRNPHVLWKAIGELLAELPGFKDNLKIRFIGKTDYCVFDELKRHSLGGFVENYKYLPHDKALAKASGSALLLLALNNTQNVKGITTGKIYEYIALKRPVLCIGDKEGDAAKILAETLSGTTFGFDEKDNVKKFIVKKFDEFQSHTLEANPQNIERYSRDKLTADMVELFNFSC